MCGGGSALGRRFRRGDRAPWVTVVGVVASLRRNGRAAERTPQIYLAAAQTGIYPVRLADVAVRGTGGVAALSALVREEVTGLDAEQPISRVIALDEALARELAPRRFGLALLAGFALTALLLTLVGIYGVAATDAGTYALVAVLLALAGLAAALGPGLRAARVDPVAALRWE